MTFSIIIPVYNAEKYLRDTLESILSQNGQPSYEVILVDDGSRDTSGVICDEYAAQYPNFRTFHTENRGASAARNFGIAQAQGAYILFLDADDLWKPDLLETVAELLAGMPDAIIFGGESFSGNVIDRTPILSLCPMGESGMEYLHRCFSAGILPPSFTWAYAYKRDFLLKNGIRFREDRQCSEDYELNMRALSLAGRLVGTTGALYRYRLLSTSLSHSITKKKLLDNLTSKAEIYRLFPCAATARKYVENAVLLAQLPRKETGECEKNIRDNRDILQRCEKRVLKLVVILFRLLGYYAGSWLYLFFKKLHHAGKSPDNL